MKFVLYSTPKIVNYDNKTIESIENKIANDEAITEDETTIILDNICFKTRMLLTNDIFNDDFCKKDLYATSIINNYFKELNVITHPCNTKINIDKRTIENNFLIVEIKSSIYNQYLIIPYLVDITFRQFFTEEKCNIDQLVIKHNTYIKKPYPGYYLKTYDVEMISSLLSDGYQLFDPDLAESYSEMFIKSMKNTNEIELLSKHPFQYFDVFLNSNKIKTLSKNILIENNLLIEPINPLVKKM